MLYRSLKTFMIYSTVLFHPLTASSSTIDTEQWSRWGVIIFTLVSLNLALGGFASRLSADKHPRIIAGAISFFLTTFAVILVQVTISSWIFDLITLAIGAFLTLTILWALSKRDKKAVNIAEARGKSLHTVDKQITYVLGELINKSDDQTIRQACRRAVECAMVEIVGELALRDSRDLRASLLLAQNGRFKVFGDHGISAQHIPRIEANFSYNNPVTGVAGLAAYEQKLICIDDLRNSENENAAYWTQIATEKKEGSIMCWPIFKSNSPGNRAGERELVAVLCISSDRENSFSCDSVVAQKTLTYYEPKLEMLINCYIISELHNTSRQE